MTKFINAITGGVMWVADNRVGEYMAAGHKPAAALTMGKPIQPKAEEAPREIQIEEPEKKKPVKKTMKAVKRK
jgi:hypothetical protein